MKQKVAIEIIACLFILLFVYAGTAKMIDYQKFVIQIGQSPLLTGFGSFVPWLVIASEFIIAILLTVPRFRLIGFFASFSLMVMFTAYIIAILNFSSYIPCSCGGVLEKLSWSQHLVFNIAFVILGLAGILLQATTISNSEASTQPVTAP